MKNIRLFDIIIVGFFLILSSIIFYNQFLVNRNSNILLIVTEKGEYKYSLEKNRIITINGKIGVTIIEIKNNKFRFVESACRNKNCVKTGWVGIVNYPVVCLPNRVSAYIQEENKKDFDVITR